MQRFHDFDNPSLPAPTRQERPGRYRTMQERFAQEQGLAVARDRLLALYRPQPWGWLAL